MHILFCKFDYLSIAVPPVIRIGDEAPQGEPAIPSTSMTSVSSMGAKMADEELNADSGKGGPYKGTSKGKRKKVMKNIEAENTNTAAEGG